MRTARPAVLRLLRPCALPGLPLLRRGEPFGLRFLRIVRLSIAPSTRVAAALEGERRWATVLFGDLVGFTHLSEATDPEDVRLFIDRCTSEMGAIVDRYGGWIDKVIGDALMAVFGAPVAHDDDAERAVLAGLELQRFATENAEVSAGWRSGSVWTPER